MLSFALVVVVASSPFHQQQVTDLEKIIALSGRQPELLFRLADLWMEEARAEAESGAAAKKAIALFAGGCLSSSGAIYEAYLALFARAPRAYELRFYRAELLYAAGDFARAAEGYRSVVDRDVACKTSGGCEPGRFLEAAAWGEIKARDALEFASVPQQGSSPVFWFRGQAASMSVRAKSAPL